MGLCADDGEEDVDVFEGGDDGGLGVVGEVQGAEFHAAVFDGLVCGVGDGGWAAEGGNVLRSLVSDLSVVAVVVGRTKLPLSNRASRMTPPV